GCGILGLFLQRWPPERHMSGYTRDLINRVIGLAGTMTALVLGLLLIASCEFREGALVGMRVNERDAPIPTVRGIESVRP
ncbi:MAG TPA: hypothetical protein VHT00_10870, partial [Stellaceae bacterium]|nr:hypothetical protein [Stellaceae bacterium]